jgi:hypothetical protein
MKWWHWALIAGGGYVVIRAISQRTAVPTTGAVAKSWPSPLGAQFHGECCKRGTLLAGTKKPGGPGLCNCYYNNEIWYSYKYDQGTYWGTGAVEGHAQSFFANIAKQIKLKG